MGIGCPPATYPFELLLIGLDSANLTIGGAAVALLRLRNVGRRSRDRAVVSRPGRDRTAR